jgi:serine/threonine protein kinase
MEYLDQNIADLADERPLHDIQISPYDVMVFISNLYLNIQTSNGRSVATQDNVASIVRSFVLHAEYYLGSLRETHQNAMRALALGDDQEYIRANKSLANQLRFLSFEPATYMLIRSPETNASLLKVLTQLMQSSRSKGLDSDTEDALYAAVGQVLTYVRQLFLRMRDEYVSTGEIPDHVLDLNDKDYETKDFRAAIVDLLRQLDAIQEPVFVANASPSENDRTLRRRIGAASARFNSNYPLYNEIDDKLSTESDYLALFSTMEEEYRRDMEDNPLRVTEYLQLLTGFVSRPRARSLDRERLISAVGTADGLQSKWLQQRATPIARLIAKGRIDGELLAKWLEAMVKAHAFYMKIAENLTIRNLAGADDDPPILNSYVQEILQSTVQQLTEIIRGKVIDNTRFDKSDSTRAVHAAAEINAVLDELKPEGSRMAKIKIMDSAFPMEVDFLKIWSMLFQETEIKEENVSHSMIKSLRWAPDYTNIGLLLVQRLTEDFHWSLAEEDRLHDMKSRILRIRQSNHESSESNRLAIVDLLNELENLDFAMKPDAEQRGVDFYTMALAALYRESALAKGAEPLITKIIQTVLSEDRVYSQLSLSDKTKGLRSRFQGILRFDKVYLHQPSESIYEENIYIVEPRELTRPVSAGKEYGKYVDLINKAMEGIEMKMDLDPGVLDKFTVIAVKTPMAAFFTDSKNNVVRLFGADPRRYTAYFTLKGLNEFNIDNPSDISELQAHLVHIIYYIQEFNRLLASGADITTIYAALNKITQDYVQTGGPHKILDPEDLHDRLYLTLVENLIFQTTRVIPSAIQLLTDLQEEQLKLIGAVKNDYEANRRAIEDLAEDFMDAASEMDLLNNHELAVSLMEIRDQIYTIIQENETGLLPADLPRRIFLTYLAQGDLTHAKQALRMIALGENLPVPSRKAMIRAMTLAGIPPTDDEVNQQMIFLEEEQREYLRDSFRGFSDLLIDEIRFELRRLELYANSDERRQEIASFRLEAHQLILDMTGKELIHDRVEDDDAIVAMSHAEQAESFARQMDIPVAPRLNQVNFDAVELVSQDFMSVTVAASPKASIRSADGEKWYIKSYPEYPLLAHRAAAVYHEIGTNLRYESIRKHVPRLVGFNKLKDEKDVNDQKELGKLLKSHPIKSGQFYFVITSADGMNIDERIQSLSQLKSSGHITQAELDRIVVSDLHEITRTINTLHGVGFYHRDLGPKHVYLDVDSNNPAVLRNVMIIDVDFAELRDNPDSIYSMQWINDFEVYHPIKLKNYSLSTWHKTIYARPEWSSDERDFKFITQYIAHHFDSNSQINSYADLVVDSPVLYGHLKNLETRVSEFSDGTVDLPQVEKYFKSLLAGARLAKGTLDFHPSIQYTFDEEMVAILKNAKPLEGDKAVIWSFYDDPLIEVILDDRDKKLGKVSERIQDYLVMTAQDIGALQYEERARLEKRFKIIPISENGDTESILVTINEQRSLRGKAPYGVKDIVFNRRKGSQLYQHEPKSTWQPVIFETLGPILSLDKLNIVALAEPDRIKDILRAWYLTDLGQGIYRFDPPLPANYELLLKQYLNTHQFTSSSA